MKAAIYESYGTSELMEIKDVSKPIIKATDRILVKVVSASLNQYDNLNRKGYLPTRIDNGLTKPKIQILGIDVAGIVEEIGEDVEKFKVGDRVFGSCLGSHAEYVCVRQDLLSPIPENLSFEEAAAIPCAAQTALQALRDIAKVKSGDKVLIYGASGGVGHFAIQLAKYYGAEVTAVCSTSNMKWIKDLGAHNVIDYTREDFSRNGIKYNVILDAVGKRSYFSCLHALTEDGIYITEHPLYPKYHPLQLIIGSLMFRKKGKIHLATPNGSDLDLLRHLVEKEIIKPVIEKVYALDDIVDAYKHIETGRAKGKIIVKI